MEKYILKILFFIFFINLNVLSQDYIQHHRKYWFYKSRLNKINVLVVFMFFVILFFTQCTLQKRLYRQGYHFEWIKKNNSSDVVHSTTNQNNLKAGAFKSEILIKNLNDNNVKNISVDKKDSIILLSSKHQPDSKLTSCLPFKNKDANVVLKNKSTNKKSGNVEDEQESPVKKRHERIFNFFKKLSILTFGFDILYYFLKISPFSQIILLFLNIINIGVFFNLILIFLKLVGILKTPEEYKFDSIKKYRIRSMIIILIYLLLYVIAFYFINFNYLPFSDPVNTRSLLLALMYFGSMALLLDIALMKSL